MKKIGEYTVRGRVPDNGVERIILFDGSFETAYKVTRFVVFVNNPADTTNDIIAKLAVDEISVPASSEYWDASSNVEIGWAGQEVDTALGIGNTFNLVDRDNMIVENLYLYVNSAGDDPVNYYIELEKYDITDWQGALSMVRNKSQA